MNHPDPDDDPRSSGFEYSRRMILKTGVTVSGASAVAGCWDSDGGDESTPEPGAADEDPGFIADGLRVRRSELVSGEDGYRKYLRVVVESELDETIPLVGLTVQFFEDGDDGPEFLDVHQATITGLAPREAFEGYVRCFAEDPAAYVIHADRTDRKADPEPLDDVDVTHCLAHRTVTGSVTNNGSDTVPRLRVAATFYNDTGDALCSGTDTVTQLGPGEETPFEVDFNRVVENERVNVDDYAVSVGDYSDALLAVR